MKTTSRPEPQKVDCCDCKFSDVDEDAEPCITCLAKPYFTPKTAVNHYGNCNYCLHADTSALVPPCDKCFSVYQEQRFCFWTPK